MSRLLQFLSGLCLATALTQQPVKADDNLIAHRLYKEGQYAEAAEIYTDPAWKGIALYRSSQWWRAAEAFVRADDADSYYNLGNTYVKLGYYALALEAYLAALTKVPEFPDARFNADLMRALLAEDDQDQNAESALQPRSDELDRVESDSDESGTDGKSGDDESLDENQNGEDREGATDSRGPSPDATADGDSDAAGSEETSADDGVPEGGNVKGTETEPNSERNPSGGSEGKDTSTDAQAAGLRTRLETEQATEQWLNQINHDPLIYLQQRIKSEVARRRAAGISAPEGGSQW